MNFVYVVWSEIGVDIVTLSHDQAVDQLIILERLHPQCNWEISRKVLQFGGDYL